MTGSATDSSNYWTVQGDRVLVSRQGYDDRVFKIVRAVDTGSEQLRLINEAGRNPDWALTQKLWDALKPAPPECVAEGIKWLLVLK